ncbi:ISL3 family transposase, partial [Staphylococcus aureus]|nr:ISL3 family transposase [Staphylococcus aureus]
MTKSKLKETSAPMCNDTLELLRIKDENIKYINQEIDVIIKGKKATV